MTDCGSEEGLADDTAVADRADEDQQRGEGQHEGDLAMEEKDIGFATFKRQIDGINEGDCCALAKASYDHNKCSECKEAELTIKEEGMQA
eukprot:COSAG02_NODE_6927_length_3284_cov_1.104553_5_plen_89_part_01